jgi:hypothetical protein
MHLLWKEKRNETIALKKTKFIKKAKFCVQYNIHHTYSVVRVLRTPIIGDKVPEQLMSDSVLQTGKI